MQKKDQVTAGNTKRKVKSQKHTQPQSHLYVQPAGNGVGKAEVITRVDFTPGTSSRGRTLALRLRLPGGNR